MLCSNEDHLHVVLSKKKLRMVASLTLLVGCWFGFMCADYAPWNMTPIPGTPPSPTGFTYLVWKR